VSPVSALSVYIVVRFILHHTYFRYVPSYMVEGEWCMKVHKIRSPWSLDCASWWDSLWSVEEGPSYSTDHNLSTGYLKVPLVNSTTCSVAVRFQQPHHKWLNSILVIVDTSVNPVPNAQVCYFNNVWFMF
jgi:hypothetical protein